MGLIGIARDKAADIPIIGRRPNPLAIPAADGELRYALVGCGDIGVANAAAIAAEAGATLVAVGDPATPLAQDLSERHGVPARSGLDEVLAEDDATAVVLAVPHFLHAPLTIQALEGGLDVVVEKPIALNPEEGARMIETAERTGRRLTVILPERYRFAPVVARDLIGSGAIGTPFSVRVWVRVLRTERYWQSGLSGRNRSDWRTQAACAGGGVLMMNAVHLLDAVSWVLDAPIDGVRGHVHNLDPATKDVEDVAAMVFRVGDDVLGVLDSTTQWALGEEWVIEIGGTAGSVRIGQHAVEHRTPGRRRVWLEKGRTDPRHLFYRDLTRAWTAGEPAPVPAASGQHVQEVVDAAYRSALAG